MESAFDSYIGEEPTIPWWRSPLTWSILVALGWLIFEVTAQPVLGAVVACLKFGWEDYLTGRWLRRFDPDRSRGEVCYHTYLAYGFLKVVVTATLIVCAVCVLEEAFKRPAPSLPAAAAGPNKGELFIALTILTGTLGLYACIFHAIVGLGLAMRYRLKLWLDSRVRFDRRSQAWPPLADRDAGRNRVKVLWYASVAVFPVSLVWLAAIASAMALTAKVGPPGAADPEAWICAVILAVAVGASLFVVVAARQGSRRVTATSPAECWGTRVLLDLR